LFSDSAVRDLRGTDGSEALINSYVDTATGAGESAKAHWPAEVLEAPRDQAIHTDHSVTPARHVRTAQPFISWRAHAMGLHSLEDLKLTVLRQRSTWWHGRTFHCPLCDLDFVDASGAAEHVVLQQHPVLRMD
jgi:hypothetical protein